MVAVLLVLVAAGCTSQEQPQAATPSGTATPADSPQPSTTEDATPTLTAEEEAAWEVYRPQYFERFPFHSSLHGDNYGGRPLTEVIELCGTKVQPVSTPAVPQAAMSMSGGGVSPRDRRTVTRSIAVYDTAAAAHLPFDAIAEALTTCTEETSKTLSSGAHSVFPIDVAGALAWRLTDRNPDGDTLRREVWTVTLDGRALLIQHEAIGVSTGTRRAAAKAGLLLRRAEFLRKFLVDKTG